MRSLDGIKPAGTKPGAFRRVPDSRSLCDRLEDVLAESHREDTSTDFNLGLLQGALAISLPQLHALEAARKPSRVMVMDVTKAPPAQPLISCPGCKADLGHVSWFADCPYCGNADNVPEADHA